MHTPFHGKVVVITGASSGIGRATAEAFAKQGAIVVLAARREQALHEVADACERLGAVAARIFPLDVTDEAHVRELARRTHEEFGRLDVWINDAAVSAFGRFDETPSEVFRRVVETNLFGYVHGARAALPYLRERGGVLVNVGSITSEVPRPYTSPYAVSKHGIHALSRCLRQEMALLGLQDKVHIVDVIPGTIDTPLFENAANYTGYEAVPLSPVHDAHKVARRIVKAATKPRDEIHVGRPSARSTWMSRLAPRTTERSVARRVHLEHLDWTTPAPHDPGSVFLARDLHSSVTGGWRGPMRRRPALWMAPLALLGVVGTILGLRARSRMPVVEAFDTNIPDFS